MRPYMLSSATGGGAVLVGKTLHGITEVAQQMPPVGHLDGIRCALANAVGIGSSTVAGDDLDPGTTAQPPGECRCLAIRQQIDDLVGFQVHQHGAVVVATSPRPIVNPEDPRRGRRRLIA